MKIINYFINHWDIILGIVIAYISLVLPIYKYLQDKRTQERDKRFDNYHKLIDELVGGQPNKQVMLDRQIAIVYELRNFKTYFPLTLRILTDLSDTSWKDSNQRLKDEITLTKEYIESSRFTRMLDFRNK